MTVLGQPRTGRATASATDHLSDVLTTVRRRSPGETVFHQAVEEVLHTLAPALERHPEPIETRILGRLCEREPGHVSSAVDRRHPRRAVRRVTGLRCRRAWPHGRRQW